MDHPVAAATLADAVSTIDRRFDAEGAAAEAAAPVAAAPAFTARTGRFLRFTIDSTSYAVPEAFVTELDRVPKITLVPQAPPWLRGVTNLRGDVLSVVDLRVFVGLDQTSSHTGRMLIVRLLDEEMAVGLLVDTVDQILTLELDAIRAPASPLEGPLAPYLAGMCVSSGRLVAVLDLERLLRSADLRQFDDIKEDSSCEAR
jgi:purine-binding chemotaxis protein CheW